MTRYNDLTNKTFGYLTVIEKVEAKASNGGYKWKCECVCGKETIAIGGDLIRGKRTSCGCRGQYLVGHKFGTFTVIEKLGKVNGKIMWRCKCSCEKGTIKDFPTHKINSGKIKSCGCQRGTHRMTGTKFYRCWNGFKQRCDNQNNVEYPNYGGRGITYQKEWVDFTNFYNDMYESYLNHVQIYGEKETTLDRIDVDKGYSKDNCRWLTNKEQSNNKRDNTYIEINDEKKTLAEWCRYYNVDYNKARRIYVKNKSIEEAFELKNVENIFVKRLPIKEFNIENTALFKMCKNL